MSFNHRLVKHEIDNSIGIYEVYYNEDNSIRTHSEKPIIVGNNLDDLLNELNNLNSAKGRPILEMNILGDIVGEK